MNFPGPLGSKRRRMRSGGNVSSQKNNVPPQDVENVSEQKTTQTSNCKGASTIPIFLKKTYKMIDTCDPEIASWSDDGEMFVVKDPDSFASEVIPQYFDHNKFSSFARQLNFYGFRKMQSKPIRNSDLEVGTAKHVAFFNENFKRGRCDLLKMIQRSTRGSGTGTTHDQSREVARLREQVASLEDKVANLEARSEERVRRLELDMLGRMEQMMLAVQQQQRTQLQLEKVSSVGTFNGVTAAAAGLDSSQFSFLRGASISNSVPNSVASTGQFQQPAPPTLPPHPKQKQLPAGIVPQSMPAPPNRLNSLRGISQLTRGMSGLSRGASVESSASAALLRGSWDDAKLFSLFMLEGNDQQDANAPDGNPITVSEDSMHVGSKAEGDLQNDDMSDVSNPDM